MEILGKIGDPMESDGEKLPDLREVRSEFSEAFRQFRVFLALTGGPWAGNLAGRRALRAGFAGQAQGSEESGDLPCCCQMCGLYTQNWM